MDEIQDPAPDSAMATGSDAGEPGGPGPGRSPGGDAPYVEASPQAGLSADDDAPLPALAPRDGDDGDPDDGLTPSFREPPADA